MDYSDEFEFVYGRNCGWLIMYCQIYRVISLFMTIILIISLFRKKGIDAIYPVALTLLGIMVFLMLWETNRKHNICFVPVLVILMESGFYCLTDNSVKKCKVKYAIPGIIALFIASDIFLVIDKPYFTNTPRIVRDYSLYHFENRLVEINDILKSGKSVEQVFSTKKAFNVVAVHFKENDVSNQESSYKLSLYKDDVCIRDVVIGTDDLSDEGWHYIKCDERSGSYSLKIEGNMGSEDTMGPLMMEGIQMVPYRNTCLNVNGNDTHCSLSIHVYNEDSKTVVSNMMFRLILGIVIVMQIIAVIICALYCNKSINLPGPRN